jgi:molybdopterin synthase catalytic subunit
MNLPSYLQSVVVNSQLSIQLKQNSFQPLQALAEWHQMLSAKLTSLPAAESNFIGRVRPYGLNDAPLEALELEHYPGMCEAQLHQLAETAAAANNALAVLVWHRVGKVLASDVIVLVAVVANHRGQAQRCSQALLEALKHEVPFWKKEWLADGSNSWVQGNTPF